MTRERSLPGGEILSALCRCAVYSQQATSGSISRTTSEMTRSPDSHRRSQPRASRRLWLLLISRTSMAVGLILLAGIVGASVWVWIYIHKNLAPLVQKNLQQLLGRPVQVGKVQDVSFNSLRFGASSVPPTATDPDNLRVKAVQVQFDLWELLRHRTLKLNVTLFEAHVYIAQDSEGRWVTTVIKTRPQPQEGLIKTELESIRVDSANVLLFPYSQPKKPKAFVGITQVNGIAQILQPNQQINFTLSGQPNRGGNLRISGQSTSSGKKTNLRISASSLLASDITRLLELPIDLQGGRLSADLTVQLQPTQPRFAVFGTVGLNQVTAKIGSLPKKFSKTVGNLEFQGQAIALENFSTIYGSIPLQARGTLNTQTGFNIAAQIKATAIKNLLETVDVNLPVSTSGSVQADLRLQGKLQQPILTGTISTVKEPARIDRLAFSNISTQVRLNASEVVFANIQATPVIGGQITGSGRVELGARNQQIAVNLQGRNLPGDAIAKTYNISPTFTIGSVSANTQISGTRNNLQTAVQLQAPAATYSGQVEVAIANKGTIQLQNGILQVAGGTIQARGTLAQGNWQAFIDANQLQLSRFPQIPPQYRGILQGEFALSGTTKSFQLAAIAGSGQASIKLAQGTVKLNNIRLDNGNWQAVVNASQIPLTKLAQNLPPAKIISSNLIASGTTESLSLARIQVAGQASVRLAGGTVNLKDIRLSNGQWQTAANISQLQLSQLAPQLRGQLNGKVRAAGNTASFQLADLQAEGEIRLSQGLAQLQQPLIAQFQWNGQKLQLSASTPQLTAVGTVTVQTQETPQIAEFNLNVRARDYNLQNLPFTLPGNVAVTGLVDFTGQLKGTPTTPVVSGNIRLQNLKVNKVAFSPLLTGQVNSQPGQGTQLQLTGKQDKIFLTLASDNRPTSFFIQRNQAVATGTTKGENLFVNVRDFPVALLENFILPSARLRPVSGSVSAFAVVNLAQKTLKADVAIAQPRIGTVVADAFQGRISFANGTLTLQQGQIRQDQSLYLLSGELPTSGDRPLQIQLSFEQARIEKILQVASIFGPPQLKTFLQSPDVAGAQALQTQSIGLPNAPLLTQLSFYSRIQQQIAQQRQQQQRQQRIPTLLELTGKVSGNVAISGSWQQGLNVGFNLIGFNWQWGDEYKIARVTATGNYTNQVLSVQSLQVTINGSLLAFQGQLGKNQISGQGLVQALPIAKIKPFLPQLPVEVTGTLNTLVTLEGSLNNPSAVGKITLVNATVNQQPVDAARVDFNYNSARLNFDSTISLAQTGTQPVKIAGSIPLALPFAAVKPDTNQINIQAKIQNQGLAAVNAFTKQFRWISGSGQVNVKIQGTLNQPTIHGIATIAKATLQVQNLPKPLTNVTGTIRWEGDRIIVNKLQGEYSQGQIYAQGILPIFASTAAQQQAAANPLTISSQNLQLVLPGLYQGQLSGNIIITGTSITPQIGGNIRLSNGEISLGQTTATATKKQTPTVTIPTATPPPPTYPSSTTSFSPPLQFASLRVVLANNVSVTQKPLFSFVSRGNITLNGTLANPRPQGKIRLRRGQVNLFVTQFALARGYQQTATFTPNLGLDPILNVRLVTFVPEVSRSQLLPTTPTSSEINDISAINYGTLNTVRIQATIQGRASELSQNLQLTSEPARSEAEIIALLGGSFLNVLGQSNTSLSIFTLAGSPFFTGLQGTISQFGEAIGLRDLRIFPTIITDSSSTSSVLGLAAEAVVGVSRNLSGSISGVFATNEPLRYNIIYRVNNQILLRGSTNLSDESRILIEYEKRF